VNFITTELHKSFSPLYSPAAGDDMKQFFRDKIAQKFDYVDGQLSDTRFLMGDDLTLPDPYLFVMLGWAESMGMGLDRWPNLKAFRERMLQRPGVRQVLKFEGLLQEEAA
jgi:glutathione S-transferase